ncbi:holliday junction resolvase Yen1p [Monosporozyma servazzii]
MGVPQIWDIIRSSQYDDDLDTKHTNKSPFYGRVILNLYLLENKPKIAIDAYHILFECGFFQFEYLGKPILNLLKRLKELIALDISFIFVFDGLEKPREKNVDNTYINRSHPKFMSTIKELFQLLNISMVQAPGEGEVQCCVMEAQGKVDLVWTNDSDSLLFGGNHIIKNYSKFEADVGVAPGASSPRRTGTDNGGNGKENFVTMLKYEELLKISPTSLMNQESLLLFSVLLGADYHIGGVKGLGREKAYKIVSLKDPNFAHKFYKIFEMKEKQNNTWDIQYQYEQFQKELFEYCKIHSVELFGRNYSTLLNNEKGNFDNWPPITIINHYFHPLFDEEVDIDALFDPERYLNVKGSVIYHSDINFMNLKSFLQDIRLPQISNFEKWFHDTMHEMCLLKYILYDDNCGSQCKITEEKIVMINDNLDFMMKYWKVRYNSFLSGVTYEEGNTSSRSTSPVRSPTKRQIDIQNYKYGVWIPQASLPDTHRLVREFRDRERERLKQEELKSKLKPSKRSPKKRFANYKQNNNLDLFFTKHTHPLDKNVSSLTSIKTGSLVSTSDIHAKQDQLNSLKKRLFIPSSSDEEGECCQEIIGDAEREDEEEDSSLIILEEKILPSSHISTLNLKNNIPKPNNAPTGPSPTKKHHTAASIAPSQILLGGITKQLSFNEKDGKFGVLDKSVSNLSDEPVHMAMTVSPVVNRTSMLDKQVPLLSRTDTFGYKKDDRSTSLLDAITLEADEFLHKLEDDAANHSDASTASTATSSSLSLSSLH